MTLLDRILAKVEPEPNSGCLLWLGACAIGDSGKPYPRMRLPGGGWDYVYRVVYREMVGVIPDGHQIDHTCKVTLCVRWVHLEAVTPEVNLARSNGWGQRNAQKTTCPGGHPYDYVYQGTRRCRQCDASNRRRAAARRQQEAAAYEDYHTDPGVSFP